jgi:hypothetical protein
MTRYLLLSCFCGAPSPMRGRVCLFYMLLDFASAVFLGPEYLGTSDHILLSYLRRTFSSPPTTRRVTVEVFDPTSTRVLLESSQSHIATDGQLVSLTVTVFFWGSPSLTRRRVCLLYMLLALASAVFLGSESLGTRDRILLSQPSPSPSHIATDGQSVSKSWYRAPTWGP